MMSISPTSRGMRAAQGLEIAYYATVSVALVIGILGTHGLLQHSLHGFMNHTLPNVLSTKYWFIIGAGIAIVPQILKLAVKKRKVTEQEMDQKANALSAGRSRIKHADEGLPPLVNPLDTSSQDVIPVLTRESCVDAILALWRGAYED